MLSVFRALFDKYHKDWTRRESRVDDWHRKHADFMCCAETNRRGFLYHPSDGRKRKRDTNSIQMKKIVTMAVVYRLKRVERFRHPMAIILSKTQGGSVGALLYCTVQSLREINWESPVIVRCLQLRYQAVSGIRLHFDYDFIRVCTKLRRSINAR